ncbi:SIMPL domain-containing protein [Polluticoccus soli]|uniref:SIMPL domain-containing protein n=1 Tax=Polluticoccus soli TaxID=3034150 RepID=UPI0023E1EC5A|nr:SIMPL domain-containing protein [Flavipsychrobacter sp. JY13-12]
MRSHIPAIIFALAIVIAAAILGTSFKSKFRQDATVSVIGSAEHNFVADLIVWSASFQRTDVDLKLAYSSLQNDAQQVQAYLTSNGIARNEIIISAISIEKEYDETYNEEGHRTSSVFKGYKLNQTVKVESKNINNVEKVSRDITQLIQSGIELNSQPPMYYYTKLADIKLNLLAKAAKDAGNRARTIADNSGSKLGDLKRASMGIFQITGQYSNEDFTSSGAFNTSSKNKTASITVRAEFRVH